MYSEAKEKGDEHEQAQTGFMYEMLNLLEWWLERQLEAMAIQVIVCKHDKTVSSNACGYCLYLSVFVTSRVNF